MSEIWKRVRCSVCGGPFIDEIDWVDRHDDEDGQDCHASCCPSCFPETDDGYPDDSRDH